MTHQITSPRLALVLGKGRGDDVFETVWVEGKHLGLDFL